MSDRESERADVLAYLARKRANAETLRKQSPEFEEQARWVSRWTAILEDDIRGGLHLGEVALQEEARA